MKVIGVDVIPVALRLASRYDDPQARIRMHDIDQHIVVRVRTDTGLIGYGDEEDDASPIPEETIAGSSGAARSTSSTATSACHWPWPSTT